MKDAWILAPLLVQVLLTIVMYIRLVGAKKRAVAAGEVDEARRALHDDAWPDYVLQINNNIRNQFEVPVLFYVVSFGLLALQKADIAAQALAWLFVLSRIAHAVVHTGSNFVPLRRRIFTAGVLLVLAMTLLCGIRLALSMLP
ncbi:MAG: MAPEG family protein [Myxococcales bacterium]|nr:MAPEG family protein [Myxococcales bacterium]